MDAVSAARRERVSRLMAAAGLDAVICRLPQNVVMLTGYLPTLGNSFCIATRGSNGLELRLAIPEDDRDLVPAGVALETETYTEETLSRISTTIPSVEGALGRLLQAAGISGGQVGYEGTEAPIVAAYTQVGVPGTTTVDLYRRLLPGATLVDATGCLAEMAAVKVPEEIEQIRACIDVARIGFDAARGAIRIGTRESDVAATTQAAMVRAGHARDVVRVLPHVHVMSGARAALAYRAYNLTSDRVVQAEDTVLVQMEVCLDGYWAELTRTFFAGGVADFWARAHELCRRAQDHALAVIRNGTSGREADAAARHVLDEAGLGQAFKHGLGHGVGFQAINHSAQPKLHPAATDTLHAGMVHNMEPAVYVDGEGGLRLNDNVAVDQDGADLLSGSIPRELEWLVTEV